MTTTTASNLVGNRNAKVLALCQGLFICAISVDLTLTGITGYQLAPDKALATLPFALITVGSAVVTVLASFVMARFGRRVGFTLGGLFGTAGGLVSVWAILQGDFWLFCLGTACVGAFQAFAQFYSLAAADSVDKTHKSRAISTVLAGGVVAAIAGPALADWAQNLIADALFAGAYLMVAGLALASALILLAAYRDIEPVDTVTVDEAVEPRRLAEIVRQPIFIAGVSATMTASVAMLFVMTATPLAAIACNHSISDGASIVQWHLMGMFAPSLFSGRLVARFGVSSALIAGLLLIASCSVIALNSTTLVAFYLALLALGLGWNFMIIAGTTLLSLSYRPNEAGKTQALAQLLGNVAATLSTLSAGAAFAGFGWSALNLGTLLFLTLCVAPILWGLQAERRSRRLSFA